ncbi:MAG: hypothetical protein KC431_27205 [Myxococcales bacterium]|nr:hypothetical protein [Myxococcales bacterium]
MSRLYRYIGPLEIAQGALAHPVGTPIHSPHDLEHWSAAQPDWLDHTLTATFIVLPDGTLRVAPRRSEHVGCALGGPVAAAGELILSRKPRLEVISFSNQSTGYCPEPDCLHAIRAALAALPIPCPAAFTPAYEFRRCVHCGERNLIKDDHYECDCCGLALPQTWNFDDD